MKQTTKKNKIMKNSIIKITTATGKPGNSMEVETRELKAAKMLSKALLGPGTHYVEIMDMGTYLSIRTRQQEIATILR
jgi:hypothetical protein